MVTSRTSRATLQNQNNCTAATNQPTPVMVRRSLLSSRQIHFAVKYIRELYVYVPTHYCLLWAKVCKMSVVFVVIHELQKITRIL